jgi:lipopolysaccharide transport system ATP-binding protein
MNKVIKVEGLSKQYRLGQVGTGTLSHDLNRLWYRIRGKEDPYLKIGDVNDRSKGGDSKYVWALRDIDFDVNQGEVLGIIGRNGAGKSTLLKILSKITKPTTGTIQIKGRIASLLEVGTGFHPELTGRENVFLNGAILGMTKTEIKSKFDAIVDFAGIERYIDTPVKRYSSGMYVRLAFAVAAYLEPEILIIDEVLAVGDAEFQKKCLGRMKDISVNDGRTVLFVSHNLAAISTLCNRALLMNNGTKEYEGNVEQAISLYLNSKKNNFSGYVAFTGEEKERFGQKNYVRLVSLSLKNKEVVTDLFRMGDTMKIHLELNVIKPNDDFEIGIGIGNLYDNISHLIVSSWEGFSSIKSKGETTIEIEIPKIYLFPGTYSMFVWVALRGAYYDDAVHNAISFNVEEGKVNEHDTYFERFSKNTQVYTQSKWKLV